MLKRSFAHLPLVDFELERRYWQDGVLCWEDLRASRDLFGEGPPERIVQALEESHRRLSGGDARWFEKRLPEGMAWRIAREFDDGRIAYIDIECDGMNAKEMTCGAPGSHDKGEVGGTSTVAIWDGRKARVFVRAKDLDEIPAYLAQYPVLCSFSGKTFDIPFLEARFGKKFYKGAHLDLRFITNAAGLTGGLKKIEQQIGIERPKAIAKCTGYDAVKFWRLYHRRNRLDALEQLARYNLADAINLQQLLRHTYNLVIHQEKLPFEPFTAICTESIVQVTENAIQELLAKFR